MSDNNRNQGSPEKESLKIEWFGLDGFLCLLYLAEAVLFAWAMITNNDFVIGTLVPYGVAAVTTAVFIKYLYQVISFSRKQKRPEK